MGRTARARRRRAASGRRRVGARPPARVGAGARRGLRQGKGRSRPVSRVLSWMAIHLGRTSPSASSDLPEPRAGRANGFLFGLAPGGVCHRRACCQPRGALLPHHFTLACRPRPTSAVCFLLHFPWARAPQALPGTMPCGARTFLPATHRRGAPHRHCPPLESDRATARPTLRDGVYHSASASGRRRSAAR